MNDTSAISNVGEDSSQAEKDTQCLKFLENHAVSLSQDEDTISFYYSLKPKMRKIVWRLCKGDKTSSDITFHGEFDKYPKSHLWNLGLTTAKVGDKRREVELTNDVKIFWSNYSHLDNLLLIRRQTTGLCYMHAQVTLQHYLITMATNGEKSKMMDIGRHEAQELSGDALRYFLTNKLGGNSVEFLKKICCLDDYDLDQYKAAHPCARQFKSQMDGFIDLISKGCPALVSKFLIYDDFLNNKANNILCGKPKGNFQNVTHAMVLIGIRKEVIVKSEGEESKYFYLLQNWWKGQYFVEVDAEYMCRCEAILTFVSKVLTGYDYDRNQLNDMSPYVDFAPFAETAIEIEEEMLLENMD